MGVLGIPMLSLGSSILLTLRVSDLELQNSQTPTARRTHETEKPDEYPFADEDALHLISTGSLGTHIESLASFLAIARPATTSHNIHTEMN